MRGEQLQRLINTAQPIFKKHGTTILTCIGVSGVVATAVAAVKDTPKATRLLEKAKAEKGADLTKMETIKAAGPAYIPTAIVGATTIACIIGAQRINQAQIAALASAYTVLDNTYKEYRDKVKELLGEETDIEIKNEIAKDKYEEQEVHKEFEDTTWFFEEFRGEFFESTIEDVQSAEYHFNRNYALRGYSDLNEFYDFLGLSRTDLGDTLGWSEGAGAELYGYQWIDFNNVKDKMPDGTEYYRIEYVFPPTADYMDY